MFLRSFCLLAALLPASAYAAGIAGDGACRNGAFPSEQGRFALARVVDAPRLYLLGDMDGLKTVNDTHGHTAGNSELRRLADALGRGLGPNDELARVGGDEFALLTDAGADDAPALCARLRERLAGQNLYMTFGWAALPHDGIAPLELFRKADDRLYAAKFVARNHRVVRDAVASRA